MLVQVDNDGNDDDDIAARAHVQVVERRTLPSDEQQPDAAASGDAEEDPVLTRTRDFAKDFDFEGYVLQTANNQ